MEQCSQLPSEVERYFFEKLSFLFSCVQFVNKMIHVASAWTLGSSTGSSYVIVLLWSKTSEIGIRIIADEIRIVVEQLVKLRFAQVSSSAWDTVTVNEQRPAITTTHLTHKTTKVIMVVSCPLLYNHIPNTTIPRFWLIPRDMVRWDKKWMRNGRRPIKWWYSKELVRKGKILNVQVPLTEPYHLLSLIVACRGSRRLQSNCTYASQSLGTVFIHALLCCWLGTSDLIPTTTCFGEQRTR